MKRMAVTTMFALGVPAGGVGVAHAEGSCTMPIANGGGPVRAAGHIDGAGG